MRFVKFSGFWSVQENPKETVEIGHIASLREKEIDVFFGETKVSFDRPVKQVMIPKHELPAAPHIRKLRDGPEECFLKFGSPIQRNALVQLVEIWASKVFLFKEAKAAIPEAKYYVWRDCVYNEHIDEILNFRGKKAVTNLYGVHVNPMCGIPYNGRSNTSHFQCLKEYVLASVIVIPSPLIDEFVERYAAMLEWVDFNYPLYDEEVVLSCLRASSPHLFERDYNTLTNRITFAGKQRIKKIFRS